MARPTKLLLVLWALLAVPVFVSTAGAAPTHGGSSGASLLYVQKSRGGSIQRLGSEAFRLRLTGVSPSVSNFTDRPRRRAGSERLQSFIGQWGANGFAGDPPNAALVLDNAPASRDVALLTLSHPRYDRARETLTYRAAPLHGKDAALASFARRRDTIRPGRIDSASLFIDDGGGAAYTQINLSVSGVGPGETISIRATPAGSGRAAWSLGRPGSPWSNLQFEAGPSPIPVSSFSLGGSLFTMVTSPTAGGTSGFHALLSVEYEETQAVYLTVVNDPALEITASYPTAEGLQTVPLGSSPMLLNQMVGL